MESTYSVLGMMSGTSLDGLDLAYCTFKRLENGHWDFNLIAAETISYSKDWETTLVGAIHLEAVALSLLHNRYGTWLGEQARKFIEKHKVKPDFIASHGHTVFHQPDQGFTLQIGSGQHLALAAQLPVICDFRSLDVALGGQGAPLVPVGDRLLFGDFDYCLNLGGISNISFERDKQRLAYDIGPVNMLLNHLANKIELSYDKDGNISRTGVLDEQLLSDLNQLAYYKQVFPKSLGKEWFEEYVLPILEQSTSSIPDQLHTACHHIAFQISENVKLADKEATRRQLLITGGGAKNKFLVELLKQYLSTKIDLIVPEESLIDYKEAIVFGLLGVLKFRNEINTLHSVTGASRSESCGVMYSDRYNMEA